MGCRPIAFNTDSGTDRPRNHQGEFVLHDAGCQSATLENSVPSPIHPCPGTDPAGLGGGCGQGAVRPLLQQDFAPDQSLSIPERREPLVVPVVSSALLDGGRLAMAISRCDPGEGLDLTRGLEIWVTARWRDTPEPPIELLGGLGIGRYAEGGELCISSFARQLIEVNLLPLLPSGRGVELEVVLPRGRELAERTSNAAFGVVDGLALIGLQAEVQRSAAPDQLEQVLDQVKHLAEQHDFAGRLTLVMVRTVLIWRDRRGSSLDQVGNWLGLCRLRLQGWVQDLLLLGYHGKLVKLAEAFSPITIWPMAARRFCWHWDWMLTHRLQLEQLRTAPPLMGP